MDSEAEIRAVDLIVLAHSITKQRPILELAVRNKLQTAYDNPYTNYFFRDYNNIKLCVPDTQPLRLFVQRMEIDDLVWFGHNTDPVEQVPIVQITRHSLEATMATAS
tara:strand:- start:527 stop:847 length:321 start_codon:yes stop_codon:yes gene_type:complete